MEISNDNQALVDAAVKSAASNPLNMEILVDNQVTGGRFGQVSEGAKQVVKVDGNGNLEAFSRVMGGNYHPMKVKEFVQHATEFGQVAEGANFDAPEFYADKEGRRVFAFLKNNGGSFNIGGSTMDTNLFIATSFDGTMPFTIGGKHYYHRCSNMFSNIHNAIRVRNSKYKMEEHILDYKAEIGGFLNRMQNFEQNAELLINTKIDKATADGITKKLLGIPKMVDLSWSDEKLKEEANIKGRTLSTLNELKGSLAKEIGELGMNAWAYLNGVTHFTTHKKNKGEGHGVDNVSMKYNGAAFKELIALTK